MKKEDVLTLSLPSDLCYLALAQLFVRETANLIGFAGEDVCEIELALEEALSNVITHAYGDEDRDIVDIICVRVPLGIQVTIKEKGIPFDPRRLPQYKPTNDIENLSPQGMGIFLMKKTMDEVSFHNLGPKGKETRLTKYLRQKDSEKPPEDDHPLEKEAPTKGTITPSDGKKIPYMVRRMEQDEAIEISRCAYRSHGYSFFDDHIYYPERLVELDHSGIMISAVAATEDGKFMGHTALKYPYIGARIAELTYAFVNAEYRGQGCLQRLCAFLIETPKEHPISGIFAFSVTNHMISQKVSAALGLHDCGLQLATSPATWNFKGLYTDESQRISVVLSFQYLVPPATLNLYPPAHHTCIIGNIYRKLGAHHTFVIPTEIPKEAPSALTEFKLNVSVSENCADITVLRYGRDFEHELKHLLRDLCIKKVAAIQLALPLENPTTYFVAPETEKLGFFFCGILPQTEIGESLIMQYLNNTVIDYDKILLYSEEAKEIREYIMRMS